MGDKAGLISGGMKCEAGRLLACDCARSVGSVGSEVTGEVGNGAGVDEIATLLRAWVKVDVAGAESIDAGGMAEGNCIGMPRLDSAGRMAGGAGIGMAWLDEAVEV